MDLSWAYDRSAQFAGACLRRLMPLNPLGPMRVVFELTYDCNLNCGMCYEKTAREGKRGGMAYLDTEMARALIRQLPRYSTVTITGGEPLLHPEFKTIISEARPRHILHLVTNGVLLTDDMIDFILGQGITAVCVSIDGPEELHDALRGLPGSFARTASGVARLLSERRSRRRMRPHVDIKTLISRRNSARLRELLPLIERLRPDTWTISLPSGSLYRHFYLHPLPADLDHPAYKKPGWDTAAIPFEALEREIEFIRAACPVKIRFYPVGADRMIEKFLKGEAPLAAFKPCNQPWMLMHVSPEGIAFPCLAYEVGNIAHTHSLRAIWHSPAFRAFRKRIKERGLIPPCLGCCYLRTRRAQ